VICKRTHREHQRTSYISAGEDNGIAVRRWNGDGAADGYEGQGPEHPAPASNLSANHRRRRKTILCMPASTDGAGFSHAASPGPALWRKPFVATLQTHAPAILQQGSGTTMNVRRAKDFRPLYRAQKGSGRQAHPDGQRKGRPRTKQPNGRRRKDTATAILFPTALFLCRATDGNFRRACRTSQCARGVDPGSRQSPAKTFGGGGRVLLRSERME